MTQERTERSDTKLLFAVAGAVVAAALGITLLASMSVESEVATPTDRRAAPLSRPVAAVREAAVAAPVFAMNVPDESVSGAVEELKTPGSTVDPQVDVDSEPAIVVDAEADLLSVAHAAYREREFDKASAYFEAEVEARPDRPYNAYMLGLSRWKAGRPAAAAEALERSAELDPGAIRTFINLSRVRNDLGEHESALDAARAALAIDAEDPAALHLEGRSLRNLGRTDEAIEAIERSLAVDPDNGYVHNLLGLIFIEQNLDGPAVEHLSIAAELEPEVAFVWNNLGMAYELHGEPGPAIDAYRRAVAIDSSHPKATVNLARLERSSPVPVVTEPAPIVVASSGEPTVGDDAGSPDGAP